MVKILPRDLELGIGGQAGMVPHPWVEAAPLLSITFGS